MGLKLETGIIRWLAKQRQTLVLAESCTGGYVSHRLTNVPGASEVFRAGVVSYSNESKQSFLGVRTATLARWGAVSEPVARAMARGARRRCRTDYAVAITGIAGPGGGTREKPLGTVFIAVASAAGVKVWKRRNPGTRLQFKERTARQALQLLRQRLTPRQARPHLRIPRP